MTNKKRLVTIIDNFIKKKILIVGDLMLDEYIYGTVDRISPEAPVPVISIYDKKYMLGGAANTAHNLTSLSVSVLLIGLIGKDDAGKKIKKSLKTKRIQTDGIFIDNDRPTTVKTRILTENHQLIRVDNEWTQNINSETEKKIINFLNKNARNLDAVLISDYAKGLLTDSLVNYIINFSYKNKIKVFADPTPKTFYKYKGVFLLKPNKKEAETIAGKKIASDFSNLNEIAKKIMDEYKPEVLLISLGKDGLFISDKKNRTIKMKTEARDVFDVSGAGDTTISTFAASLVSGASLNEAALISNLCAGIVVGKIGTAVSTKNELKKKLEETI